LFGDNRGVVLAPFNVGYKELKQHLDIAELQVNDRYV